MKAESPIRFRMEPRAIYANVVDAIKSDDTKLPLSSILCTIGEKHAELVVWLHHAVDSPTMQLNADGLLSNFTNQIVHTKSTLLIAYRIDYVVQSPRELPERPLGQ